MVSNYRKLTNYTALAIIGALTLAPAGALGQANVTCLTSGVQGADNCSSFINTFCNTAGTTTLSLHDSVARCFNAPNGLKCDFTAWNSDTSGGSSPSPANCKTVLNNAVSTCPMGGTGRVNANPNFFTVDPNEGPCPINVVDAQGS